MSSKGHSAHYSAPIVLNISLLKEFEQKPHLTVVLPLLDWVQTCACLQHYMTGFWNQLYTRTKRDTVTRVFQSSCVCATDLGRCFWRSNTSISSKIYILLSFFLYDKLPRNMLHNISFVSVTTSQHIIQVTVWRDAAHEHGAATKVFKSEILQHVDAVGKSFIQNAVKLMICITCHQPILCLPACTPLYWTTRICFGYMNCRFQATSGKLHVLHD